MNIKKLYEKRSIAGVHDAPDLESLSDVTLGHTMGDKLSSYLDTKLSGEQKKVLRECIENRTPIEVHGACFEHYVEVLSRNGCSLKSDEPKFVERRHKNSKKRFNNSRPKFLLVDKGKQCVLMVFVFPSKEYVFQNAEVINGWLKYNVDKYDGGEVTCVIYPELSGLVAKWTKLDKLIEKVGVVFGDILVFGYVEQFAGVLQRKSFERMYAEEFANIEGIPHYGVNVFRDRKTKKRCILLGVKYSFWGEASSRIVEEFAHKGVRDFVYLAKAGARIVKTPSDLEVSNLTGGIYSIEKPFYSWSYNDTESKAGSVKGPYEVESAISPYLGAEGVVRSTHVHLSVPSVVGETRYQETTYHECNPTTIDNEISFIAATLESINAGKDKDEAHRFSCVHYITDFVTPSIALQYGEAPGLDVDDRKAKEEALDSAYSVVATYVSQEGVMDNGDYSSSDGLVGDEDTDYPLSHHYHDFMRPLEEYECLSLNVSRRKAILKYFPIVKKGRFSGPRQTLSRIKQELVRRSRTSIEIAADSGSGKTLLMSALFYEYIHRVNELGVAPVYIDISRWEKAVISGDLTSEDIVEQVNEIALRSKALSEQAKVVLFIDGMDEYCEFRRHVYRDLLAPLKKYGRVVSRRIYPFERWAKRSFQTKRLVAHNLKVKVSKVDPDRMDLDRLRDSLSKIYDEPLDVIDSTLEAYRRLFGKGVVNVRLFSILAKEPFVDEEYRSSAELLHSFT
ncbi:MAG: hypothetical protein RPV21_01615 [Candidatus Sedimenticola sp. (ex Thyasira tokunagai)]